MEKKMSNHFKKEDLRVVKTYKALLTAMFTLLNRRNFGRITVNDLCKEAMVSRAAFYAHFDDKYDLLRYWLDDIQTNFANKLPYIEFEREVNGFIHENGKMITNLIKDANYEVLELFHDFMFDLINRLLDQNGNRKKNPNHMILSHFCSGGILNLLVWQVKNKFPSEFPMMTPYFYDLLKNIIQWDTKQE